MPAPSQNLAPSQSLAPNVTATQTTGGHGKPRRNPKDVVAARLLLGQWEARQPPAQYVQPETEYDEP